MSKPWNRDDPLEDAIWRMCDYLQCELDWTIDDDGLGRTVPGPDESLPSTVRRFMAPLLGDGLRQARIEALRAELARLEREP